ncbi:MAG TPA: hypothetical protein VG432_10885 [Gemmatimonadaceae bacterium]|nr:hypothetical protein [Gemmatimonadaceae bacterium]
MPKRDKQHEEEQPKESTTKYEGGQGSRTREQQQANNARKLRDFDEPAAEEEPVIHHDRKVRHAGGARLEENREQHDEAERDSEANRDDRRGRADEHSDDRGRGPGSSGRGSTGRPNGG